MLGREFYPKAVEMLTHFLTELCLNIYNPTRIESVSNFRLSYEFFDLI